MILHISEAANLAIHAMSYLANLDDTGRPIPTVEISESLGVSANHLSKVLQRLSKTGLVRSVRGPKGGFRLALEPEDITLLQVYEAIDGSLPPRGHCLLGTPTCGLSQCIFGGLIEDVHQQVSGHFSSTTLASLIEKKPTP